MYTCSSSTVNLALRTSNEEGLHSSAWFAGMQLALHLATTLDA